LPQPGGQVFAGVLPAGEVSGDRMRRDVRQDVRGEGPLAVGRQPSQLVSLALPPDARFKTGFAFGTSRAKSSAVALPGRRRSKIRRVVSSWCGPGALATSTTKASKIGWACARSGTMSSH